jgi:hypothetical protein
VNQIGSNQSIRQKRMLASSDFVGGVPAFGNIAHDRFKRFKIAQNDFQNCSIEVWIQCVAVIWTHSLPLLRVC